MSARPVSALTPCPCCPWRRDHAGGVGIPNFSIDKARDLANAVGDHDAFRPIMACHLSPDGTETPCRGYLAKHGWSNLAVRMMAIRGDIDLAGIAAAADGTDLHDTFDEMLGALEAKEP